MGKQRWRIKGVSTGNQAEVDDDDQAAANSGDDGVEKHQTRQGDQGIDVPGEAYGASPSTRIMNDCITSMTPFGRLMINPMDSLAYGQRNHHEFCMARLQNLDEQIEAV